MKKLASVFLAGLLVLTLGTASVAAAGQEVEIPVGELTDDGIKGDLNGDGKVDLKDAYLLAGACAAKNDKILNNLNLADCNNDKVVDLKDVVFLVQDVLK